MSGRPALELEHLAPLYRGVYFATVALKGRMAKLGPELRPAVEEITRYQAMVKRFIDALEETRRLHSERGERS